jgi:hypothetical protein
MPTAMALAAKSVYLLFAILTSAVCIHLLSLLCTHQLIYVSFVTPFSHTHPPDRQTARPLRLVSTLYCACSPRRAHKLRYVHFIALLSCTYVLDRQTQLDRHVHPLPWTQTSSCLLDTSIQSWLWTRLHQLSCATCTTTMLPSMRHFFIFLSSSLLALSTCSSHRKL